MNKKNKAAFEAFAEDYSCWAWATNSPGERGYDEAISFLPTSPNRVLEAGCGSGVLTLKLANHVDSIVGVDISPSMIRLARFHQARLEIKNVEFILPDLRRRPELGAKVALAPARQRNRGVTDNISTLPGLRAAQVRGPGQGMRIDAEAIAHCRERLDFCAPERLSDEYRRSGRTA